MNLIGSFLIIVFRSVAPYTPSSEKLALDSVERVSRSGGLYRRDLVAREYDSSEPIRDQSAERHDRTVREERGQDPVQQLRQTSVRQDRRERTDLSGRVQDFERVLNHDRARTTAIERIRKLAESTREATQRLCDGLQQLGENVRHYLERERHVTPASQQVKRAGQQLELSTPAVGKALQHEKSIEHHVRGMGFSR